MTQPYTYNISTDTANAKVSPVDLSAEIQAGSWSEAFAGLNIKGGMQSDGTFIHDPAGKFEVHFSADLPTGEKTTLDGILSAHQGAAVTSRKFIATSNILESESILSNDAGFDEIGGVVTNLGAFSSDPSGVVGLITGSYKTDGVTETEVPQIRICEETSSGDNALGTYNLPDTGGVWTCFEFLTTTNPTLGLRVFKVECTRDGATQLEVKYITLSLFSVN